MCVWTDLMCNLSINVSIYLSGGFCFAVHQKRKDRILSVSQMLNQKSIDPVGAFLTHPPMSHRQTH